MQLLFRQLGGQQWLLAGEDGNEFESVEEAFAEAQQMANLGTPWNGATFRVVSDEDDHEDDCGLGLGAPCDCARGMVTVAEEVFLADPPLPSERFDGAAKQRETLEKNALERIGRELDRLRLNAAYGKAGQRVSKATERVLFGAREQLEQQAFQGALRSLDAVSAYPKELVWHRGTIETTGEEVADGEKKP